MRAAVVYSTRFGTTEKIARRLAAGLERAGLETTVANVTDVAPALLKEYDLLCLGGPTETLGSSKQMDEFIETLDSVELTGKLSFAFETKYRGRFSGSAAKCIQKRLRNRGLRKAAKLESAIVTSLKRGTMLTGAVLKEGEEERFEMIGYNLGIKVKESHEIPSAIMLTTDGGVSHD